MYIHLIAGGLAGSTGTVITCPLEVIKTRLQSNISSLNRISSTQNTLTAVSQKAQALPTCNKTPFNVTTFNSYTLNNLNRIQGKFGSQLAHNYSINSTQLFKNNHVNQPTKLYYGNFSNMNLVNNINTSSKSLQPKVGLNVFYHLKFIVETEGVRSLFKGLGPTLVGVAPYRAIYFYTYANSKQMFSNYLPADSSLLHIASAFSAGFLAVTGTNPIWFVKTRMQLDESRSGIGAREVINKLYREKGIIGFYKGISASYFGIIETAIYFSIYEKLKKISNEEFSSSFKFLGYFGSAGFSKSLASCLCYPHEVARTRLRQEGNKYHGFFQTLQVVAQEEGVRGLYKGMGTHLMRQIPNSMIVMITYELIVNYLSPTNSHD